MLFMNQIFFIDKLQAAWDAWEDVVAVFSTYLLNPFK